MTTLISTERTKRAAMGAGIGVIIAATVFIFIPFTLYLGNSAEFTATFGSIFKRLLLLAVFAVGLFALLAMFLPRALYSILLSVSAAASLLLWLQGNILVWDYGLLDGRSIDWSADAWRLWLEIGLWISALTVAAVAYRPLSQLLMRTAFAAFLLQTALLLYNWTQFSPEVSVSTDRLNSPETLHNIYRFSSSENVVHIIADGFQSDIFAEITQEGELGDRLASALDGFTFFEEHMGVFPYTHMTIPAIFSSRIYRNDIPIKEHLATTMGGDSILSVARDAGYSVDLAVPSGTLHAIYARAPYSNLYAVTNQQHVTDTEFAIRDFAKLLDLTFFRVSPHVIKRRIYNDQRWLVQSLIIDKDYMRLRFFSHKSFLRRLSERMSADRSEPVYKLVHLMLSHNPMVSTRDCAYAGKVLPTVRETVVNQARCGLIEVANMLERMKELGIYEDATIVLMGDHGAWVPPLGLQGIPNPDGKSFDVINPSFMALAVPLLAVKRPGDSGPLRTSSAPTWIVDTASTISKAAGLEASFAGESVFDLDPDGPRERRHLLYVYKRRDWKDDYLAPIQEFVVRGSVFDSASWRHMVTHLPEGEVVPASDKSWLWQRVALH